MATVTGLTAARMLAIEAGSIVDGEIVAGELILTKFDGTPINAGSVLGPQGPVGPAGPAGGLIPGEVRLWPGGVLPLLADYGLWTWANGGVFAIADYPIAASHIAPEWRTFGGASDPGGANFRVPDLRGLVPAGLDQMPGGARANRMTRAVAIVIAGKTGEETHVITLGEMASHAHPITDPGHRHIVSGHANPNAPGTDVVLGGNANNGNVPFTGPNMDNKVTNISINNVGGNGAHENVQPTVFVPYIVKLDD